RKAVGGRGYQIDGNTGAASRIVSPVEEQRPALARAGRLFLIFIEQEAGAIGKQDAIGGVVQVARLGKIPGQRAGLETGRGQKGQDESQQQGRAQRAEQRQPEG